MWQQGQCSCFHPDAGSCLEKPVPSGRLIEAFISTGPPCCVASCCPCRPPRGEQHHYQNTPGYLGTGHFWALFLLACSRVWLCKSSRSEATKSSWESEPLLPVCNPLPCLPRWSEGCLGTAYGIPTGIQWDSLNVDTAMSTPELSRHPF